VAPEQRGQHPSIERVADRAPKLGVVAEERSLRVQRQVRHDRLLHDEQVRVVAGLRRGELRECRRRDHSVVGLAALELEADLGRE
jgi:hypothetical protein